MEGESSACVSGFEENVACALDAVQICKTREPWAAGYLPFRRVCNESAGEVSLTFPGPALPSRQPMEMGRTPFEAAAKTAHEMLVLRYRGRYTHALDGRYRCN